ncbi:MAG: hypothetical protein R6V01_11365, partial [Thermoplasmatota archaeon]
MNKKNGKKKEASAEIETEKEEGDSDEIIQEVVDRDGDLSKEDVFDEDEKELFQRLMKKMEDADEMGKELDSDLGDFTERVENVVSSVDRIERMERGSMEDMVYMNREEPEPEVAMEEKETTEVHVGPDEKSSPDGEYDKGSETKEHHPDTEEGHIHITTETPYSDIEEGRYEIARESISTDTYGRDVNLVLKKLMKLISIKIEKGEIESGRMLFNMAVNIGADSGYFREHFIPITEKLGMDMPEEEIIRRVEEAEKKQLGIDPDAETTVLEPELAGEITILQKKASSAIQHLDRLIEDSTLSQEDFNNVKDSYLRATQEFRDKMFHKAYNTALDALQMIKEQVQNNIDNQIQEKLYKAKEMLEDISKSEEKLEPQKIEELRTTLDRAMKAYLTNEYERSNLLVKKVTDTILDMSESGDEPLRKRIDDYKKDLRKLEQLKIHSDEVQELLVTIKKAESLLDKRDHDNAEKLLDRLERSIEEIRNKGEIYANAKEMDIKLTNKVQRLIASGYELGEIRKKLDFLQKYLEDERYQDVLKLGEQIENDLQSLEKVRTMAEVKGILDGLEEGIVKVDELDDPAYYKSEYSKIKVAYQNKDLETVKRSGASLLEDLNSKLRTRLITRGKKLARNVVESKMLLMKLRSLKMDTSDLERDIRKAKNLIKEGKNKEGVQEFERINA